MEEGEKELENQKKIKKKKYRKTEKVEEGDYEKTKRRKEKM
jgi:hypothetical protein